MIYHVHGIRKTQGEYIVRLIHRVNTLLGCFPYQLPGINSMSDNLKLYSFKLLSISMSVINILLHLVKVTVFLQEIISLESPRAMSEPSLVFVFLNFTVVTFR